MVGVAGRLEGDPVADDREAGRAVELGVEPEPARRPSPGHRRSAVRDQVRPAILDEHPARLVPGARRAAANARGVGVVPTPVGEVAGRAHRVDRPSGVDRPLVLEQLGHDPEAETLVQVERPPGVAGVDPERGPGRPRVADRAEALGEQGPGEPAPPERPAGPRSTRSSR